VTAGVAAPAYAGIPVTHRGVSSAVAFVTAHEDPEKDSSGLDWAALAAFPGTLVFYMGVRSLGAVADRLIRHGRSALEPVAVVEQGTLPGQQTVTATLEEIAARVEEKGVRPPAVTVVGPVALLREHLAWIERAPLRGKTVAVTRARPQASALAERLTRLGAEVVEAPAIRIVPKLESPAVREAVRALAGGAYDVVCLTSPNGADLLLEALHENGLDARALAGATLAAIGPGTANALARGGLQADIVPERSVAEALAAELTRMDLSRRRVLIARAAEARDVLPNALREAGAEVEVVPLYETIREELGEEELAAVGRADYVTFTSSSTVRNFLDTLGGPERLPIEARVVSIGPVTSATARELGLNVDVEAERHDVEGLVEALLSDALLAVEPRT
jgi:uroporphyrinogen III methyltransferase/synthase